MYKVLKIGGKDYKLEYGIEASLFDDCVKSVMNMLVSTSGGTDRSLKEMVSGMRNYIVHEYFQVDDNVVWDVVTHDLPVLEKQITSYIEELAKQ